MANVTVRVYATLIEELGWRIKRVRVSDSASLLEVLEKAGLRDVLLDANSRVRPMYKVLINGRDADFAGGLSARVGDGDIVDVFPPVAGGVYAFPV